MPKLPTTKLI